MITKREIILGRNRENISLKNNYRGRNRSERKQKRPMNEYPLSEKISFIFVVLFVFTVIVFKVYGLNLFSDCNDVIFDNFSKTNVLLSETAKKDNRSYGGGYYLIPLLTMMRMSYKKNPLDIDAFFGPTTEFRRKLNDEKNYPIFTMKSGEIYKFSSGNTLVAWR